MLWLRFAPVTRPNRDDACEEQLVGRVSIGLSAVLSDTLQIVNGERLPRNSNVRYQVTQTYRKSYYTLGILYHA
jgi:hypothetical protein